MSSSTPSSERPIRRIVADVLVFLVCCLAFDRLFMALIVRAEPLVHKILPIQAKLDLERQGEPYQALVFGTSRAWDGLLVSVIQEGTGLRTFTEAASGKGPRYNLLFYRHYQRTMGTPRAVIYGVDYFIGSTASKTEWLARFPDEASHESHAAGRWFLLLANKPRIDAFVAAGLDDPEEGAYMPDRRQATAAAHRGRTGPSRVREEKPPKFRRVPFVFPGREGAQFIELLDLLARDGVQVFLVGLPDYIGTYHTNYHQKAYRQTFEGLAARYANVRFLNYNDPDRFPLSRAEYFFDGAYGKNNSHLSSAGAKALGRMLLADIRNDLPGARPAPSGSEP